MPSFCPAFRSERGGGGGRGSKVWGFSERWYISQQFFVFHLSIKTGLTDTMACAQLDTELTQLDMSGSKFSRQESEYLGQLLKTNRFLTHLVSIPSTLHI